MNKQEISVQLIEAIITYANADNERIGQFRENPEGKNLTDFLEYDSLSLMELIVEIEEKFDINVDEDVLLESFDNYDGILEYIYTKVCDELTVNS